MGYVKLDVIGVGTEEDMNHWKEWKLEKPKCYNKFCYGTYEPENVICAHVHKADDPDKEYIVPLCKDCCDYTGELDILVHESHLMIVA